MMDYAEESETEEAVEEIEFTSAASSPGPGFSGNPSLPHGNGNGNTLNNSLYTDDDSD
jgi:hypothetical protein